jgi:mitogen-activated protein kinase 15
VVRANILENVHKQYIIYQLLKALRFMHSGQLLHRDIKPSNLLLNADCQLRVCDFGLCRSLQETEVQNPVLTDYVATRWYRAPEILMGSTKYAKSVDIFAVGCILGEMILGKPLFPGTSTMNQIERILEVTGFPGPEDVKAIASPFAVNMLESLPKPTVKTLRSLLPSASDDAIDVMTRCLTFNPTRRPTVDELLAHPFVAQFHKVEDEPCAPAVFKIDTDDNVKYTAEEYRERIYKEIRRSKTERAAVKQQRAAGSGAHSPVSPKSLSPRQSANSSFDSKKQRTPPGGAGRPSEHAPPGTVVATATTAVVAAGSTAAAALAATATATAAAASAAATATATATATAAAATAGATAAGAVPTSQHGQPHAQAAQGAAGAQASVAPKAAVNSNNNSLKQPVASSKRP